MSTHFIGIDLGGTKIATGIVNSKDELLATVKVPTQAEDGWEIITRRMGDTIAEVMQKSGVQANDVRAIGVCSPGALDIPNGIVLRSPNLKWYNIPLKKIIEERFNIPTYFDNDANVAGLGENRYGAGIGSKHMLYMTVSTGIGGGIITDGKIYHGATFGAGEIGHITVDKNGPLCGCGNHGCIEAIASGPAIARNAKERLKEHPESLLNDYSNITAREVSEAAQAGDQYAKDVIETAARNIGLVLAGLINTLNPDCVVVGGGVSHMGELLFKPMIAEVKERTINPFLQNLKILPAKLGGDVGVMGAIALAQSEGKV
ncbi:MAG: ROK family protein [Firmicutes bacterium]|nr:ROK family protein [Bacillota bacterium]MDD4263188.1 ROK family protein [Bacillota bacterium]MDD4694524.1 ROK family protein [Bacillota bacterium]